MRWIKGVFAKSFIKSLAKSNNGRTTVLGLVAAALVAREIDWGLALAGDPAQIGTAVGVLVTVLLGYFINRPDKPDKAEEPST